MYIEKIVFRKSKTKLCMKNKNDILTFLSKHILVQKQYKNQIFRKVRYIIIESSDVKYRRK